MAGTNDNSPFNPGDRFGDYTVERILGRGSMGTVYLMRSPDGSPFAVKIMHRSAMSRDMVTRFAREAEFAMEIRHRNLITVYDAGEDPDTGLCYIIMDYMPGGTLSDRIKKLGTIPIGDAVKITMHIAAALDVAHGNGLVHRDVKPDNIMFAADGTPKLADLGVAKFNEDRNTMVTMTGMVIGTPAYMSPEQLMDSHNIDARSDIYSLGVILYEMLTGKRPNSGSTAVELLAKAIKGEPLPDIRTVRPETSATIAHVLSLMCAPKPDDRPATAVAAAQLLRNAATGKLVLPKKPPRAADVKARKSKRWIPVAAGIVGAALLAAAAMFFTNGRSGNKNRNNAVSYENLDSRSYVQDGLVAMWDGVENAGRGRHDPKAKAWKNLVGGPDAEQAGSLPVTWGKDSAIFGRDRYFRVNTLFGSQQRVTVEVCHRAFPLKADNSALFSSCEFGGIGIQGSDGTRWMASVGNPAGGYYSEIRLPILRDKAETLAFTVGDELVVYRDAKVFGMMSGVNGIRYNEKYVFQMGRDPGNNGYILGEIHSIRLYSRPLSADEIRRNHEIDRIRFNLDRVGAPKSIPAVAEKSATAGVKASPTTGAWQPGPTSDWFVNWDKALAEAKKTGKKLFVLSTGSDWCGWCKRLRANVLDKQEFIDFARKNLVLLYLDSPHANPLCKEQEVHNKQILKALGFGGGVPNVEMFSANGMRLGRIGGGGLALGPYLDKIRGILSETGEPVRRDEGRKLFGLGQGMLTAEKTSNGLPQFTDEDGFTWTYRMQGSRVGLARSSNLALNSAPCVSPNPTDVFRIPSQINGLPVVEIGSFAFNKCDEITEAYVPEGVMWLNYCAFCHCDKLRRIVLPSTLRGNFAEAFKYCPRLSTIEFSKENPNYVVDGGVVYSKDGGTLIMFPRSGIDTFDVPKTVHTIATHAFDSSTIKSINIHDGVKKICYSAFFGCSELTEIVLRKPVEMGTYVFGYSGLERITFPSGTKVIPSGTFRNCSQLKVVNFPESLERIEGHATFESCSSLVELRLPSRLRMLGDSQLFGYCKSLKRLVIPASVESMSGDGGTFRGCSQLEELIFEGNAPTLNGHEHQGIGGKEQMFKGAPSSVRVLVKKNSTGWNAGSGRGLPEKWPVEGGDGARPIAYLDSEVQKHREDPSADDRRPEPIKVHVSNSKLHAAYRSKERNRVFVEVCHSHDHESFKTPPCTLDRVKEAISCKADILHFPLSRSKDGVLFSAGRENIKNFSDGTGSIGDYTARQLKRFKVKWHGNITTKGFATLEEMLKFGKGRILFKVSGACDYAEDLCRLLGKLNAWESVIVESWDISEVQNRYGQQNWDRMRSGELQIMVGGGDGFNEWKAVVPECSVWGEACDLEAHGLKGIPQRINVGFVYGPGEADRTDDEAGWEKALKDGATIFRTNRPVELGKFLKKHGRRK